MSENVSISIGGDPTGLMSALRTSEMAIGKFGSGIKSAFGGVTSVLGDIRTQILGLASIGGLGAYTASVAENVKETANWAATLGIAESDLDALNRAAERFGLGQYQIADIMKDTAEKIADAYRNGGGEAVEALANLGLSAQELVNLTPIDQINAIGAALGNVGTQAEKIQIMESLGSDASKLIPILENTAGGLDGVIEKAKETGAVLSDEDRMGIKEATANFQKIKDSLDGIGQSIIAGASPAVTLLSEKLGVVSADSETVKAATRSTIESMIIGFGAASDAMTKFEGYLLKIKSKFLEVAAVGKGFKSVFDFIMPGGDLGQAAWEQGQVLMGQAQAEALRGKNLIDYATNAQPGVRAAREFLNQIDWPTQTNTNPIVPVYDPATGTTNYTNQKPATTPIYNVQQNTIQVGVPK